MALTLALANAFSSSGTIDSAEACSFEPIGPSILTTPMTSAERAPAEAGGAEEEEEVDDAQEHRRAEDQRLEQHAPPAFGLSLGRSQPLPFIEGLSLPAHLANELKKDVGR